MTKQVHYYYRIELTPGGVERCRADRQKLRLYVHEDGHVACGDNCRCQRWIGKQGKCNARCRRQLERRQYQPESLPAAAGPELRTDAEKAERVGARQVGTQ